MADFNEEALMDAVRKTTFVKPKLMHIPPGVITEVAEQLGCTRQEAIEYIRDMTVKLLAKSREKSDD
jgi:predicted transcriptional regulator